MLLTFTEAKQNKTKPTLPKLNCRHSTSYAGGIGQSRVAFTNFGETCDWLFSSSKLLSKFRISNTEPKRIQRVSEIVDHIDTVPRTVIVSFYSCWYDRVAEWLIAHLFIALRLYVANFSILETMSIFWIGVYLWWTSGTFWFFVSLCCF